MTPEERQEIQELKTNVKEILSYIKNDETTGRLGLYSEMKDVKERLSKVEVFQKITVAKKTILMLIGGAIWALLVNIPSIVSYFKNLFD